MSAPNSIFTEAYTYISCYVDDEHGHHWLGLVPRDTDTNTDTDTNIGIDIDIDR